MTRFVRWDKGESDHSIRFADSTLTSVFVEIYLEYLHHHLLIIGDVDCLKDFAVLATPQLPHQLEVILVSVKGQKKDSKTSAWVKSRQAAYCKSVRINKVFTPIRLRGTHSPSTPWAGEC